MSFFRTLEHALGSVVHDVSQAPKAMHDAVEYLMGQHQSQAKGSSVGSQFMAPEDPRLRGFDANTFLQTGKKVYEPSVDQQQRQGYGNYRWSAGGGAYEGDRFLPAPPGARRGGYVVDPTTGRPYNWTGDLRGAPSPPQQDSQYPYQAPSMFDPKILQGILTLFGHLIRGHL